MANSSFDVVSRYDIQEVDNAVNQTAKEISQRYDFRNVGASIELKGESVTLVANTAERVLAILDVLQTKLIRRGLSLKQVDFGQSEPKLSGRFSSSPARSKRASAKKMRRKSPSSSAMRDPNQ